ncbi:MAG: anhydro-N-acetylmuramic acid kinase [Betaproteobacteria bacterium]|nr:anhydro-N-acetylmuramic acid kinase [Betaproteobacteria bacterium]
MNAEIYAGIMTGTSLDAANAALCRAEGNNFSIIARAAVAMPPQLAADLRTSGANAAGENVLEKTARAENEITRLCADAFFALNAKNCAAIGCHGQTVLHRPDCGRSLQLLNGALLAELTGADVVCDFRARDIAAGGQGAPLAPLFHRAVFTAHAPCAVVNLGGIANITVLSENETTRGWDICPANMLMDAWHRMHCGGEFDKDGAWAQSGKINAALLQKLRAHPFLQLPPPKSCGREQFDLQLFAEDLSCCAPPDAQATLLEWSAQEIAETIRRAKVSKVFLCGGGARNTALFNRIAELSEIITRPTDDIGLDAEYVEAAAFAWLAMMHIKGVALDTPPITGARGKRILGARYPA